jgi:hypothetical protein
LSIKCKPAQLFCIFSFHYTQLTLAIYFQNGIVAAILSIFQKGLNKFIKNRNEKKNQATEKKQKKFMPKLSAISQFCMYIPAQKHIFNAVRTFFKA